MTWRHKEPGDDGDGLLVVMVAVIVYKTEFLIFRMMIADDLEAQGARWWWWWFIGCDGGGGCL